MLVDLAKDKVGILRVWGWYARTAINFSLPCCHSRDEIFQAISRFSMSSDSKIA